MFFLSYCDAGLDWQIGLQEPATPVAEGILHFHNYLMYVLLIITILVMWVLYKILTGKNSPAAFNHSSILEVIWTASPAIVLLFLAAPSFALLYSLDESINPEISLKVIGHQWYWSYEYSDPFNTETSETLSFDSYMIPTSDLTVGTLRLLEVDNRVLLPVKTHIRVLVTAADVLYSWSVPSFGIKIDACPGRLSQGTLFIKRVGLFFGQCSEICGINHGFMPIVVKVVSPSNFLFWIALRSEES